MVQIHDSPDRLPTALQGVELRRVISDDDHLQYLGLYYGMAHDDMLSGREIAQRAEHTAVRLAAEMIEPRAALPYRAVISQLGAAAGFANLLPYGSEVFVGFGVAAEYRRQGLATAAVGTLLRLAVECGYSQVRANVRPYNIASRSLLRTQGFINRSLLAPGDAGTPAGRGAWLQMVWREPLRKPD